MIPQLVQQIAAVTGDLAAAQADVLTADPLDLVLRMEQVWNEADLCWAQGGGVVPAGPARQALFATGEFAGVAMPDQPAWDHLVYAYALENTRAPQILARVVRAFRRGEGLGVRRWQPARGWTRPRRCSSAPPTPSPGGCRPAPCALTRKPCAATRTSGCSGWTSLTAPTATRRTRSTRPRRRTIRRQGLRGTAVRAVAGHREHPEPRRRQHDRRARPHLPARRAARVHAAEVSPAAARFSGGRSSPRRPRWAGWS